ncbi:MAG: carboxylating nicotinate-nucleotide diphosphorylase [Ignavibacteriae bacterium]|nr:carboxylating nicotinate-nucleotide diphosphorylase [Ignavibacteriota bacterium]
MLYGLHDASIIRLIQIALHEDIGDGDITTESIFHEDSLAGASVIVKQPGIICGLRIAELVFQDLSPDINWYALVEEGAEVTAGTVIARVEGSSLALLSGERTALNFLQRMSGVATNASRFVKAVEGTGAIILDTRKTIPGWRLLDKYAAKTGGSHNHRIGLFDMVMIKDNHIAAAGGIHAAIKKCHEELHNDRIKIEVETQTFRDVWEVVECGGIHRIMFDNFTPELMKKAVEFVDKRYETEASGGITLSNVREFAETGVDFISIGAITHSAPALDISMDIIVTKPMTWESASK